MSLAKFIIGSAQFGMNYGIANASGQVSEVELQKILNLAVEKKINLIDTAPVYGTSEEVLGKYADPAMEFISKIPAISLAPLSTQHHMWMPAFAGMTEDLSAGSNHIEQFVNESIATSLQRLKRNQLHGLLIHHADDLLGEHGKALYHSIASLKDQGKVKKIGVSVYSPEQANKVFEKFTFDILQFPFNLLDQRFLQAGFLENLKDAGVELHARSIFLQGLLLMDMKQLPCAFTSIKPSFSALYDYANKKKQSVRQTLIDFIVSNQLIDHFIIGIDNFQQFAELVSEIENAQAVDNAEFASYACTDVNIINPSKWVTIGN